MYLHLGEETAVRSSEIIGIFDIENTSVGKHTKEFLAAAEKGGNVVNVNYEMPKSFIVCENKGEDKVYISP
ncbi:MAG: extracellular matrix regulator RemB, partial [Oscillospiraceae bacterium]